MGTRLINSFPDFGSLKNSFQKVFSSPERIMCFWIIISIVLGTVALYFEGLALLDTLFCATSAVCVTGLEVVPWHTLSDYGKLILMILVQIGGLGFMTFSFFISWGIFGSSSIGDRHLASELFGFKHISKMRHFLFNILRFTFTIQALGSSVLAWLFYKLGVANPFFNALFFSVSSFCNAGISPVDPKLLGQLLANPQVISVLAILAFFGSIGFPFLHELISIAGKYFYKCTHTKTQLQMVDCNSSQEDDFCTFCHGKDGRLSINSKVSIIFSSVLIAFSAAVFFLIESHQIMLSDKGFLHVFCQAIFLRSAGFGVFDINKLAAPTILFFTAFMFVGGASGSTAGGIKTSTFAVILSSILSLILKREQVVLFSRTISSEQIKKALSIFILNVIFIFLVLLLTLWAEKGKDVFKIMVECIGAVSTSGFTFGLIREFSLLGKIIMIFTMILGRIGVLTFLSIFTSKAQKALFKFPKEKIFIG